MKKLILPLIFILLPLFANTQVHLFGFQGGYTFSNTFLGGITGSSKPGHDYSFGANYEFRFKSKLFLGVNFLFQQRKMKNYGESLQYEIVTPGEQVVADQRFIYHYLAVPLKFGFHFGQRTSFDLGFGIVPAVLVHSKYNTIYNYSVSGTYEQNISSESNKFMLGAQIEMGFTKQINSNFLFFISVPAYFSILRTKQPDVINGFFMGKEYYFWSLSLNFGFRFALPSKDKSVCNPFLDNEFF